MAGDGGNGPPRFTSRLQNVTFVEGAPGVHVFPAAYLFDPDGDPLLVTWTVNGGPPPAWLQTSSSSLTLQGTPPPNSPDYLVSVTVTDGENASATESFTLVTAPPAVSNRPPLVTAALAEQVWAEGVAGAFTVPGQTFADPDGDALSFSARLASGAALPSWLGFDPSTRSFSGTPPAGSDDVTLRVTATDPGGASVSADLVLRTPSTPPITGSAGPETIDGTAGADVVNALAGDDTVNAGAGDDIIDGGAGADRLNGGVGSDTSVYPGSRSDYLVSRNSSGVVTVSDRFGTMDTLTEVETLRFGGESVATSGIGFAPAVSLAAAGASSQVHRFYNVRDRAYFYTDSSAEKDEVVRQSTDTSYTPTVEPWPYFYQGATFAPAAGAGALPVYRFYNRETGHHFFTVSEAERELVRRESTDPNYTPANGVWPFNDEGVGFLAFADGGRANTVPVFRFFSPTLNRHFFTASADEAQQMRLTGQWTDEGTGFYGTAIGGNRSPVLASALGNVFWPAAQAHSYQFAAGAFSDADGDTLSYSAALAGGGSLPAWLSFSSASRTFAGTRPEGSADITVRLTASDGRGGSVTVDFTLTSSAAGADDYANDASTAGLIDSGQATSGVIESENDQDWFRINFEAGRTYQIDLEGSYDDHGTLSDPVIDGVYTASGSKFLGSTNDNVGSKDKDARVTFTSSTSGEYFIAAGGAGASTGSYLLTVAVLETVDYAADSSTEAAVASGGFAVGEIAAQGDKDWFRVSLIQGHTYTVDLEGAENGKGTLPDPFLTVFEYRSSGLGGKWTSIASNDDVGGKNSDARVTFTASSSGDYYLEASATGTGIGTYRLSVTPVSDGSGDGSGSGGAGHTRLVADDAGLADAAAELTGLPQDAWGELLALAPAIGSP